MPGATIDFTASDMRTERLLLTPLRATDAEAMTVVLGDERLHKFIGGRPATRSELRSKYRTLEVGSGDPNQIWLNWIVRMRTTEEPIGTVQATVTNGGSDWAAAYVAWVIGVPWQSQGFATEAAHELVGWLRARGVAILLATIHPEHTASEGIATRLGLLPTDDELDGERIWRSGPDESTR